MRGRTRVVPGPVSFNVPEGGAVGVRGRGGKRPRMLSFESAGAKRPAGAEPPEQGAWSWASRAPIANMCRFGFNSLEAACLSFGAHCRFSGAGKPSHVAERSFHGG